jgi:hypothetical protein
MPEVIACPKCDRKLRVPEENFGKMAQCPACQFTFVAQPPSNEPLPPPLPPAVIPVEEEHDAPQPSRRGGWFDEARRRRQQRDAGDGDLNFDYDSGPRRSHRGGAVLALGILGIVFACIPILGGALGLIAVSMASGDLQEMARRRMDRSGHSVTQAGQVCGIIAMVLSGLITIFACTGGFRRF